MFAFVFQAVKDTDHEFYRDVLHPSIHGDALQIAMRIRDYSSRRTWFTRCSSIRITSMFISCWNSPKAGWCLQTCTSTSRPRVRRQSG
jgi:hypothetical protein